MKVKSMGRNVTELHLSDSSIILVSYTTPVAIIDSDCNPIKTNKFWSVTTSRHIDHFFGRNLVNRQPSEKSQDWFDNLLQSG